MTDVFSRRIIGWQTTYRPVCTDLAAGALQMAVWQRKRTGADLTGLVRHLRPWGAVQVHPLRGYLWPRPRRSPRWVPRETSFRLRSGRGAQLAVQGRADPVTRALGRTSTPPVLATAEWVHWYGHHPATLRRRHAYPRRARSRLGPRRQPEQPETITTGNHRHQVNQPPQNPRLDTRCPDLFKCNFTALDPNRRYVVIFPQLRGRCLLLLPWTEEGIWLSSSTAHGLRLVAWAPHDHMYTLPWPSRRSSRSRLLAGA